MIDFLYGVGSGKFFFGHLISLIVYLRYKIYRRGDRLFLETN